MFGVCVKLKICGEWNEKIYGMIWTCESFWNAAYDRDLGQQWMLSRIVGHLDESMVTRTAVQSSCSFSRSKNVHGSGKFLKPNPRQICRSACYPTATQSGPAKGQTFIVQTQDGRRDRLTRSLQKDMRRDPITLPQVQLFEVGL